MRRRGAEELTTHAATVLSPCSEYRLHANVLLGRPCPIFPTGNVASLLAPHYPPMLFGEF